MGGETRIWFPRRATCLATTKPEMAANEVTERLTAALSDGYSLRS